MGFLSDRLTFRLTTAVGTVLCSCRWSTETFQFLHQYICKEEFRLNRSTARTRCLLRTRRSSTMSCSSFCRESCSLVSSFLRSTREDLFVTQLDDENGSYRFHFPIASREDVHFPRWVRSCSWYERNSTLLQLVAGPMSMLTTTMRLMMSKWMALVHWSAKMYQSPCLKDRSALLIDLIDNNGEGYHKVMNECQSTDLPRCFWEFSLFRLFPLLLLLLLALLSIASMVNGRDSSVEEKDAYLISLVVLSSFVSVHLDESRQKV